MGYLLNLLHGMVFLNKSSFHDGPEWLQHKRCSYTGKLAKFRMRNGALLALQGYCIKSSGKLAGHDESSINHRVIYCCSLLVLQHCILMFQKVGLPCSKIQFLIINAKKEKKKKLLKFVTIKEIPADKYLLLSFYLVFLIMPAGQNYPDFS